MALTIVPQAHLGPDRIVVNIDITPNSSLEEQQASLNQAAQTAAQKAAEKMGQPVEVCIGYDLNDGTSLSASATAGW